MDYPEMCALEFDPCVGPAYPNHPRQLDDWSSQSPGVEIWNNSPISSQQPMFC